VFFFYLGGESFPTSGLKYEQRTLRISEAHHERFLPPCIGVTEVVDNSDIKCRYVGGPI